MTCQCLKNKKKSIKKENNVKVDESVALCLYVKVSQN